MEREVKMLKITDAALDAMVGRTVTSVDYEREEFELYEVVTITFADGSKVALSTFDGEGYKSGLVADTI